MVVVITTITVITVIAVTAVVAMTAVVAVTAVGAMTTAIITIVMTKVDTYLWCLLVRCLLVQFHHSIYFARA